MSMHVHRRRHNVWMARAEGGLRRGNVWRVGAEWTSERVTRVGGGEGLGEVVSCMSLDVGGLGVWCIVGYVEGG